MKKRYLLPALTMLLSATASAGYVERLREFDSKLLCFVLSVSPAIAGFLLVAGGFMLATGEESRRRTGKSMVVSALVGLLLVVAFVIVSKVLVPTLDLGACF